MANGPNGKNGPIANIQANVHVHDTASIQHLKMEESNVQEMTLNSSLVRTSFWDVSFLSYYSASTRFKYTTEHLFTFSALTFSQHYFEWLVE
jgi:hypothetical protein